jgi:hypothetical protein
MTRARAVCLYAIATLALWIGGCATWKTQDAISVRIDCNVPDATIWVDDTLVGTAANWKGDGKYIRSGFHRIEIRHPAHYSHFQEIDLPSGGKITVVAKLEPLVE